MISRSRSLVIPTVAFILAVAGSSSIEAQRPRPPECRNIRPSSNFRLNSANLYIRNADRTRFPEDRARNVQLAMRQLTDAAGAGGSDELTLWFLFGQAYVLNRDLVGADSAYTRAERVADDDCRHEITRRRRNEWVPFLNMAVMQTQAGNQDSALTLLRRASVIFRNEPTAFLRMAAIFAGRDLLDSAVVYFDYAAHSSQDPRHAELRAAALFAAGRLLQGSQRWQESRARYREFLALMPGDMAGLAGLGAVLQRVDSTAAADAIFEQIRGTADTTTSYDLLFQAGTELFRGSRFELAARVLDRAVTLNRCAREGLYNLASAHLAQGDTARMLAAAERLYAVDPMNRPSIELLAQANAMRRNSDRTVELLLRRDSLPWTFDHVSFTPGDSTASLVAIVNNNQQTALPAFALQVEFVNGACEPVVRDTAQVPALAAGASHRLEVTGRGRGIQAYRYGQPR